MKEERVYLIHIVETAARLQTYIQAGKEDFLRNEMLQDASIKLLSNVTESASNLTQESKSCYPAIDWKAIKAFRNILVHDYLGDLDMEELWKVITMRLPELDQAAQELLQVKYGITLQPFLNYKS